MLIESRPQGGLVWSGRRPAAGVAMAVDEARPQPTLVTPPAGIVLLSFSGLTHKRAVKRLVESVSRVAASSAVKAMMIQLESSGGPWSGLSDAWRAIRAAADSKPVWCYADDVLLGTGLYLASACSRVVANPECLIGDVGTFAALHDHTRRYAADDVDVHLVRAGAPLKGQGIEGTAISPELIAETQRIVDRFNAEFLRGLQVGRGLTARQAATVNTGAVWFAPEAKRLGLIDEIMTLDAALALMADSISSSAKPKATKPTPGLSATSPPSPVAVTPTAAQPKGPTMPTTTEPKVSAREEWRSELHKLQQSERCDYFRATRLLAQRRPDLVERCNRERCQPPAASRATKAAPEEGPHQRRWRELVDAEYIANGKVSRRQAASAAVRKHPAAHQAFIEEANS